MKLTVTASTGVFLEKHSMRELTLLSAASFIRVRGAVCCSCSVLDCVLDSTLLGQKFGVLGSISGWHLHVMHDEKKKKVRW